MILSDYLKEKKDAPFVWGQNDCVYFAAKYIERVTGNNFYKLYPDYQTREQALEIIKKNGNLQTMVTSALGDGFTNHLKAHRGDIVLLKVPEETLGIVDDTGQRIACVTLKGLLRARISEGTKFWRLQCLPR